MIKKAITIMTTKKHSSTKIKATDLVKVGSDVEVDYIKIPKDFQSLHDLKELIGNYDLVTRLTSALNNYNRHYLDSYLMSADEVLQFIPESQWYDYDITCRGQNGHFVTRTHDMNPKESYYTSEIKMYTKKKYPEFKSKTNKGYIYFKIPLNDSLISYIKEDQYVDDNKFPKITKEDKVFIVNTLDKKIEVVMWATSKLKTHYRYASVEYDIKRIDYELDAEKNLTIKCPYSYTASQAVGGVWINGRATGYLRGEKYVDYTIKGYDIYKFCTRTNQFLGYKGFKEDKKREWVDLSGRYRH